MIVEVIAQVGESWRGAFRPLELDLTFWEVGDVTCISSELNRAEATSQA